MTLGRIASDDGRFFIATNVPFIFLSYNFDYIEFVQAGNTILHGVIVTSHKPQTGAYSIGLTPHSGVLSEDTSVTPSFSVPTLSATSITLT